MTLGSNLTTLKDEGACTKGPMTLGNLTTLKDETTL